MHNNTMVINTKPMARRLCTRE